MKSKKRQLLNSRLYLVLDKGVCPDGKSIKVFSGLGKGAVDLVQLRANTTCDKELLEEARVLKQMSRSMGVLFIINNRPDIARMAEADGLHLGQSDIPLVEARRIFKGNKIIGISCHNLSQALSAQSRGADYISIGPLFRTKTKPGLVPVDPGLITMVSQKISIPFFVIGGINRSNIGRAISYGARRVALCRAICAARNIKKASLELKKRLAFT
ncbi:thiamine phosphate synthase [Candidatus Omnitrophota bacterium]